eukprot:966558-Prorocentrum_lima.AAC.1
MAQKRQAAAAAPNVSKLTNLANKERERHPGGKAGMTGKTRNDALLGDPRGRRPGKESPKALPTIAGANDVESNVFGPARKAGRNNAGHAHHGNATG